jgi:protein-disulfide isomerase
MAKRRKKTNTQPETVSSGGGPRTRTRERRHEREQEKRRRQRIMLAIGAVIVAVVGLGVYILATQPAEAPIPAGTLERYEGIPQTRTEAGFPVLGRPDAPVRVAEYSSFSCPACAEFHDMASDQLVEQVRRGAISLVYVPMATGGIPNAEGASRAALCAGEQGAFFEYHDMLFHWQRTFGNQAFTQNRLNTGADTLGLNRSQFSSCLNSGQIGNILNAARNDSTERGIASTPTILVDGFEFSPYTDVNGLMQRIEQAVAASPLEPVPLGVSPEEPAEPEVEETPEVTPEATEPVEEVMPEVREEMTAEVEDAVEGEDSE